METEIKNRFKENGLSIVRFNCKEGYIDYTNCSVNPDYYNPGGQHTSRMGRYFRLNNTVTWLDVADFKDRNFLMILMELHKGFTAQELWDSCLIK